MKGLERFGWRSAPFAIFAVAILIVLGGIGIIYQSERAYMATREGAARTQAGVVASSVSAAVDFNDPGAAQQAVQAFAANPAVRLVGVYDRDGRTIARYARRGSVPATLAALPPPGAQGVRGAVPIKSAGQRIGTAVYELDREPVYRRLSRYATLAALLLLTALVVTVLGLAQAALRRANRELADRAEALAQANALLEEQMEERAKAEEQLRQSQKMQALGQLTGGIAHDFNNLLTVIQGSADMLTREQLSDERRMRFAQAIVHASSNAAALTSQLLAFARRQPLKPERLDLNQVIRDMADLIQGTVGERVKVDTALASSSCAAEVDRVQLQSAILNIASNARDAMEAGGRLTIATRDAERDGAAMIALDIADSGGGMDEATVDRIFEPFFTTKGTGKGTGLGLSQVYGFASQSGGDVTVRSAQGVGTVVTLLLPCSERAIEAPTGVKASTSAQSNLKLLVVEDNAEVGAFAETLLGDLGHDVTLAISGEQGLALCRKQRFDLVLSDVVMPGMGGLKLAEMLALQQPELPVILATGYSQEIADSGSGGRPVILKPYRLSTLTEAIAEAMRPAD